MKYTVTVAFALLLAACANSPVYSVEAYSSNGRLLSKRADLDANEKGITMARSTLCKTYPSAIIRVSNNATGKEVSRSRCR